MKKLFGCEFALTLLSDVAVRLWPSVLVIMVLTTSGACLQQAQAPAEVQLSQKAGIVPTIAAGPSADGMPVLQAGSNSPSQPTAGIEIGPIGEAATGNGIEYHGGPLMLNPHNVYFIWYGNWTGNSATTVLPSFISGLSGSPYFGINTTYENGSNQNMSSSTIMAGQIFDSYSGGSSLSDSGVQTVVNRALLNGSLPRDANGIYFVLTSADVNETSGFCTSFCGWHTHFAPSPNFTDIKYAFIGNPDRCPSSCISFLNQSNGPNGNRGADGMADVIAHELDESVTDPDLNAWYHTGLTGENGDLCNFNMGSTFTAPNGTQANVTLGGRNFLIQQNWLNDGGGGCHIASTGNVFLYPSAHDQYYGCHGIASGSVADCNNISDANDRLMCQAIAQHSQTPCSTPVTDRNLQLSCFGIAFAPNFPTNCRDITNPQMQSFCYGVSSGGSPTTPNCSTVADSDARALCNGMALHDSSFCSGISNANDRQFCLGVSSHTPSQCSTISSCPDPNAQAACLNGGGTWNWSTCSCQVACDPADEQACIDSGGNWDPTSCTCGPGCGRQIQCAQSPGALPSAPPAQEQSKDIVQSLQFSASRNEKWF